MVLCTVGLEAGRAQIGSYAPCADSELCAEMNHFMPQPHRLILPGWIGSQGGSRGRFAGRNVSQWWVAGRCGLWVDGAGLRVAVKCEPVWIGHLNQLN